MDTQVIALLYKRKDLRAECLDMLQPDTATLRCHCLQPSQREVTLWVADAQPPDKLPGFGQPGA